MVRRERWFACLSVSFRPGRGAITRCCATNWARRRARPWRARYARALGVVLGGGVLLLIGVLIATNLLRRPAGQTPVELINAVVFWPLLVLQLILSVAALTSTSNFVSDEMRRQNWDNLRATEHGAEMSMRARWVAVFYRLRGLVGLVLACARF